MNGPNLLTSTLFRSWVIEPVFDSQDLRSFMDGIYFPSGSF